MVVVKGLLITIRWYGCRCRGWNLGKAPWACPCIGDKSVDVCHTEMWSNIITGEVQ